MFVEAYDSAEYSNELIERTDPDEIVVSCAGVFDSEIDGQFYVVINCGGITENYGLLSLTSLTSLTEYSNWRSHMRIDHGSCEELERRYSAEIYASRSRPNYRSSGRSSETTHLSE